jgi:hypothetical protein
MLNSYPAFDVSVTSGLTSSAGRDITHYDSMTVKVEITRNDSAFLETAD